jgi:hypothetical protein
MVGPVLRRVAALSFFAFVMVPTVGALEGCKGSSSKVKGGGARGADAQSAGQKVGGTASGDTSMAMDNGASYEEVTCDSSDDGVGWCDSDTNLVFCSSGHFYLLDCSQIGGDFCGEDGTTIDCYAAADF